MVFREEGRPKLIVVNENDGGLAQNLGLDIMARFTLEEVQSITVDTTFDDRRREIVALIRADLHPRPRPDERYARRAEPSFRSYAGYR